MANDKEILENVNISIKDGKIMTIGDIPEDFTPESIIDGREKIVMPGLINSHTHVAMSVFRNYADDLPFWPWLTEKIWPLEEKLIAEDVYWGSMLSIIEMIQSGITCFADMYFFMDETARAVKESGMRASLVRGLTGEGEEGIDKIKETIEFYKRWNNEADGRITVEAGPHAPYTCSADYLEKIIKMASDHDMRIHIHLSESKKEVEDSYKKHNKSPIKHVNDIGLFELPTMAAHCVHVSDEDINILAQKGVSVLNNPSSNLKLGNGFAPVEKMTEQGINVALGTDGSSSNNNLNMFEEMNLAGLINKGVNLDSTSIPASTALKMGTINGAKALGLDSMIGTIEEGKKADIILVDMKKAHLYPKHNSISALIYSAQAADVDTVIVNGEILMENRELKTIDVEEVMFNAEKFAKDLVIRKK
nr:amidohydrolase [Sporosalibacterium faouarense]